MPNSDNAAIGDIDSAPTTLPASTEPIAADKLANLLKKVDALSQKNEALEDECAKLRRDKRTTELLDSLIQPFARYTFLFMVAYSIFVGKLLWDQITGALAKPLSDDVIKLLVGSTAATVIGLVGMVLTGIFVGARPK